MKRGEYIQPAHRRFSDQAAKVRREIAPWAHTQRPEPSDVCPYGHPPDWRESRPSGPHHSLADISEWVRRNNAIRCCQNGYFKTWTSGG
ncbi:hypothetical protein, partial [Thiolapillus sp.]|uniref:hypothetical protein n=1 Tax=Thiolapillus sp. TaxID=2017437 RepID=UPI003AF80EF3